MAVIKFCRDEQRVLVVNRASGEAGRQIGQGGVLPRAVADLREGFWHIGAKWQLNDGDAHELPNRDPSVFVRARSHGRLGPDADRQGERLDLGGSAVRRLTSLYKQAQRYRAPYEEN